MMTSDTTNDRSKPEGRDDAPGRRSDASSAMRLRAEPPRVTRVSRKVLIGLGLVVSVCIGGALIYALQTRNSHKTGEELYSTEGHSTPDGLANLPKDYTGLAPKDVPKLGPPLPGDLGRPILDAQNRGQPVPVPAMPIPNPSVTAEEQRRQQELEAARTAKLFATVEARMSASVNTPMQPGATASPPSPTGALTATDLASLGLAPQPATPAAQNRQLAFLNQAPDRRTVSPDRITAPASLNMLQAGSIIPAALITGIRSDLPGQITAQVTENVYDSPTGHLLLIPQGTRIIGEYDNGVGFGQRRVLLVWNRLIFPNGRSIVLERQPGADPEGYAGLEDGVDYHWGDLFKAAALSTVLSIGAQAGQSNQDNQIVQALRQGASNSVSQVGQQVVQRELNIAPTLTIRPGFPVRVIVTHDLVLEPYGG